jgi:hypothetical protein
LAAMSVDGQDRLEDDMVSLSTDVEAVPMKAQLSGEEQRPPAPKKKKKKKAKSDPVTESDTELETREEKKGATEPGQIRGKCCTGKALVREMLDSAMESDADFRHPKSKQRNKKSPIERPSVEKTIVDQDAEAAMSVKKKG